MGAPCTAVDTQRCLIAQGLAQPFGHERGDLLEGFRVVTQAAGLRVVPARVQQRQHVFGLKDG